MNAMVTATCISEKKGTRKHSVPSITLLENHGILGDAHAVNADTPLMYRHRQVSLLAEESVDKMRALGMELKPGDFAENILTKGIELKALPIGTIIKIGDTESEVTQIGKECHNDCEIKKLTGKCVMPTEGVFAIVRKGGTIKPGDTVETSLPLKGKAN